MNPIIREIEKKDGEQLQILLSQLTLCPEYSHERFETFYNSYIRDEGCFIFVMEIMEPDRKIIACSTIIIEQKIIHKFGKVAHIEDVVVDEKERGKGYGSTVLNHLIQIAQEKYGCYKIILDCAEKNRTFYEKSGFVKKEIQMARYL